MNKMLKGTDRLKKGKLSLSKRKTSIEDFEAKAIEKLGGSIAFVSKANLLWSGDDEKIK